MAGNGKRDGKRNGAVKGRAQAYSPRNRRWTKTSAKTGRFMDQMAEKYRPFRGVKKK